MPRADADRNLLFGINALQNDFITRDALVAAMVAWALEKHRPLGEILVERGALDPADRDALEAMIARRLARHGGDPAASLAALSSVDGLAAALRRSVADPDVLGSIAQIPPDSRAEDPFATRAGAPFEPPPPGSRYTKVRDHARGGLGVVFVARDEELNREVALKEIQDRHAFDPHHRSKFLLEAEVTGGLEHPGIVPVYGLGAYEDGRPFYAMRFIRGDSLRDAIARFHADGSLESDPGLRVLTLQKLLRRFTDVCNAIEYAHSRGVLHRDLKPDNVMVGKYGETLVVDWGLAKATGRSGGDLDATLPESTLSPASASGSHETLPGSVIGTPAYMSPEQAAGRLDLLGPASDVYGLGATLYTLLTGRVPFVGKDLAEVLRHVEHGEFPRPREGSPWLDPALEAVCLRAMATRPEARYASPRALADDVDRWVAGEPVAAYPEPWSRRARRWARKHRTAVATATAAGSVAALLLGGAAVLLWLRVQKTDSVALATLAEADRLEGAARATSDPARWSEAVAEARRAEAQLEAGGGSVTLRLRARAKLGGLIDAERQRRDEIRSEERDRRMIAELDEARLPKNAGEAYYDRNPVHEAYLAAFRSFGIDVATLSPSDAAARVRSSRIRDRLIAALDDWSGGGPANVPRTRLDAIISTADDDPGRRAVRAAFARGDAAALRLLAGTARARRELGARSRLVFNALAKLEPAKDLPLLEAFRSEEPSDFWFNLELAWVYMRSSPPRLADAISSYRVAVALRPGSAGVRVNLAYALSTAGDHQGAVAECRDAVRLRPDLAEAHSNLGDALFGSGDRAGAVAAYRQAIRLKPDYVIPHSNLGIVQTQLGDLAGAAAACREAVRLKPDDAEAHAKLGDALTGLGDLAGAAAAFREAIRLKPDYAEAHNSLGNALTGLGDLAGAVAEYRKAIRLQPEMAAARNGLGTALNDLGDFAGAAAACREAIRLQPDNVDAHINLGVALVNSGDRARAIDMYRKAIGLRPEVAPAHNNLGVALIGSGDRAGAVAAYRQAIRLKPDYVAAYSNLGDALTQLGDLDGAVAACRQAIRLKPDLAEAHCNLGLCLQSQGHFSEALGSLELGHRLGLKKPVWPHPSAQWVEACRRLAELDGRFQGVMRGEVKPGDAEDRLALAYFGHQKHLESTSTRLFGEAFSSRPSLAEDLVRAHRYNAACVSALAGSGRGKDDPPPDESARAVLRAKALGWLRADLAAWNKALESGPPQARPEIARTLAHWKADADLADLRYSEALAKLPEAEREALRLFWADVEATRLKADEPK